MTLKRHFLIGFLKRLYRRRKKGNRMLKRHSPIGFLKRSLIEEKEYSRPHSGVRERLVVRLHCLQLFLLAVKNYSFLEKLMRALLDFLLIVMLMMR